MSEFLEATMLICFGISWPISLVKNIRARSAKGMSLQFLLLIIFGYIAGIAAKFITHRINYVLAVYFFNLIVVSINLAVYFRNRHLDRKTENAALFAGPEIMEETAMNTTPYSERSHQEQFFMEMNAVAPKGGIVFFGSNRFSELPVNELARSFGLEETVCNRSIPGMPIDSFISMLDVCVLNLEPRKVFVNLGDADAENPALDIDEFISTYEWILYTIHKRTGADIHVVSLLSDSPAARRINARLKSLAHENGCRFIDVTCAAGAERPALRMFDMMKSFMRSHPIDFSEAMSALHV